MIIKIHKPGRSFKGVARYLAHDAKAETTERVAWTHTLNLASDDVASAVNEMLWTSRSADLLKREAGVRTGGSKLEKPVKHFSLGWPQGEPPTQTHMIETVRAYMEHMGWQDRQAVLFAHRDKRHAHVHVVMNSVSPSDGRAVRDSHDWRRAEAFALRYEREHGQIHCEQRLKPREERDATPTRESWQRFKKSELAFERAEVACLTNAPDFFERHDAKGMNGREWDALKKFQRHQREQYFMDGKEAFRAARKQAFREVREEFRTQWNAFYAARRNGDDPTTLAVTKAALLKAQATALDERRTRVCEELRERRDLAYEKILEQQRFDRAELGQRQQQGLRTYQLFDAVYPATEPERPLSREAGRTQPQARELTPAERAERQQQFDLSTQFVIDPHAWRSGQKGRPGVLQRGSDTPRQTTDAFGRELREAEIARAATPHMRPADERTPRRRVADTTAGSSEKMRSQKAREMNDQQEAKEKNAEPTIMRASWNRKRSRGGRD
jgi:hypothetical protein